MRSLTPSQRETDDRGAVLVLVAVMMTALIGMAALVIDIGSLYVEKRQLQNGGDAAALAVAQDCAAGDCGNERTMAQTYANNNASDNSSTVDAINGVCGVGPSLAACTDPPPTLPTGSLGWVRVRTSTATPDGGDEVDFFLAPVINGGSGGTVRASAVAAWGVAGQTIVAPLIFSACEYEELGGSIDTDPATFPSSAPNYIFFHNPTSSPSAAVGRCVPRPAGQDIPGGFGWVAGSTSCSLDVTAGTWVPADTGNNVPRGCTPSTWLNTELIISIYDQTRGTGSNSEYRVLGFVGFVVLGYRFGGSNRAPSGFSCPGSPGANCLYGRFTRFSRSTGGFGGPDLGGRVIRMVG